MAKRYNLHEGYNCQGGCRFVEESFGLWVEYRDYEKLTKENEELKKEIERLKEFEWMYNDLNK